MAFAAIIAGMLFTGGPTMESDSTGIPESTKTVAVASSDSNSPQMFMDSSPRVFPGDMFMDAAPTMFMD
jgi:hypothetical protein